MALTLIATGGTIASTRDADGRVTTALGAEDLLDRVPGGDEVEAVDLSLPGSWNLSTEKAAAIARAVDDALERGADGVVVTHGTDVLEETAWLVESLVRPHRPDARVVFTGSMRHASEFGYDGPRNLADSLRAAASPATVGLGTLVCFNGMLHAARWVTKTHATALATFESPDRGPLGEVTEDALRIGLVAPGPPPVVRPGLEPEAAVPIIESHWDADPELMDWHRSRGAAGFIIEGGGAGNVNGRVVPGIEAALEAGLPVVVTTRCRRGRVTPIYGGDGGFATLHAKGAIASGGLLAGKARLSLQIALANDPAPAAVANYFTQLDHG